MSDIVSYLVKNKESVCRSLQNGEVDSFSRMRSRVLEGLPAVKFDVAVTTAGEVQETWRGLLQFPKKKISQGGYTLVYVLYYFDFPAIVRHHAKLHEGKNVGSRFDLSLDGVPESKSGGVSIDVLSIKYENCRNVFTVAIMQPARKGLGLTEEIVLEPVLSRLAETHLSVRRIIADAPKRANLRGLKQHSSKFGCPYCKAKKEGKSFPSSTMTAEPRTDAELREVAERISLSPPSLQEQDQFAGVKKLSPLRCLPIDLVNDIPAEVMHLVNLGIVRRILTLCYRGTGGKAKDVDFKRASTDELNVMYMRSKSLSAFSRNPREFDVGTFKAEEYRNMLLVYWPAVKKSLPAEAVKSWLLLVYVIRAYLLPMDKFREMQDADDLKEKCGMWYKTFESDFGARNCVYNAHLIWHLDSVHRHGPLDITSAVDYESHYNLLKRSYRKGTASTGAQALVNLLLALETGHSCVSTPMLSMKNTPHTDDTLVYLRSGQIIRLTSLNRPTAKGVPVSVMAGYVPYPGFDFSDVLVFKLSRAVRDHNEVEVPLSEIAGQAVICEEFVSVVTWNMLRA